MFRVRRGPVSSCSRPEKRRRQQTQSAHLESPRLTWRDPGVFSTTNELPERRLGEPWLTRQSRHCCSLPPKPAPVCAHPRRHRADFEAWFPRARRELQGSWFVRIIRELRHGDKAVGGTDLHAVIVRTKVLDVAEAVAPEQHTELFTLPTAHDELIMADALIATPHKFVALRYQQESAFSIQLRDTCVRQFPTVGGDPFPEEGLTRLPLRRSAPLP